MITLRHHQGEAADAVENAFRAGVTRPLVDACVGSGKSLVLAELARREIARGGRAIILAHTRELVEQNASACSALGLQVGINAAALERRDWRAPVICAAIQSVHRSAHQFGPVSLIGGDECHLWPHSEDGMYHRFMRGFPTARAVGVSGTTFRLKGGSLVAGEGAPFERLVYSYSILDGIRDGYLVPAFSPDGVADQMDVAKLRTQSGEFTGDSQDAQMIALMDSHIMQMMHYGADRRAWLVFEASVKAATAMAERMNQWGIPTGVVLGDTPAGERRATIEAFRAGRLRALVNKDCLTTGFDVQQVDMMVMRRATKSLGLYIQMTGRLLRTIGGNIAASVAAGKADGLVLDFAGNIDRHGPLDFIKLKPTRSSLVKCETCGTPNAAAARNCWSCDAVMCKLCPACLGEVPKGTLDCTHCGYDMRTERGEADTKPKLADTPSGAALLRAWGKSAAEREGGWTPIVKAWGSPGGALLDTATGRHEVTGRLAEVAGEAKWLRLAADGTVESVLLPNGLSRRVAIQVSRSGSEIPVPLPSVKIPLPDLGEAAA